MHFPARSLQILFCSQVMLGSICAVISEDIQSQIDYVPGYASDKTYTDHEGKFTLLHLNDSWLVEDFFLAVDNILSVDADIVCISMDMERELVYSLYQDCKGTYAHFYRIKDKEGLIILSKYPLEDFSYTSFTEENQNGVSSGFFAFNIKKDFVSLGRAYISTLQDPLHLEQIRKKMQDDLDFDQDRKIPFFLSQDTFFAENCILETRALSPSPNFEKWLLTSVQQKSFVDPFYRSINFDYKIDDLLCKNDSDKESHGQYDISATRDTDGTTSVRGEVSYIKEIDRGGNVCIGCGGEVRHSDRGDTKGSVEVKIKGNW